MKKTNDSENDESGSSAPKGARKRLSQTEMPAHTIMEAMRVPRALAEAYGKQPTKPVRVAAAMNLAPTTGTFRTLTGASIAYELTEGGGQGKSLIGLTELGTRTVAPKVESDDVAAMQEAFLRPRIIGEFMRQYDGSKLPKADIGKNVLEDLGVPTKTLDRAWKIITGSAEHLGLLTDINGQMHVDLEGTPAAPVALEEAEDEPDEEPELDPQPNADDADDGGTGNVVPITEDLPDDPRDRRVYITHGKTKKIAGQLKQILDFGEFEPIMSVEKQTTAKPVPKKVMDDMRGCGGAIIHVTAEQTVLDQDGNKQVMLNENVLIEIGAAMALYEDRFILLVEEGVKVPSNMQGLYEVRYTGEELDQVATMKLLEALREFKKDDEQEEAA